MEALLATAWDVLDARIMSASDLAFVVTELVTTVIGLTQAILPVIS